MMSLERFKTMDPFILLSAVNMQLRDEYSSLEDLCKAHDIDEKERPQVALVTRIF